MITENPIHKGFYNFDEQDAPKVVSLWAKLVNNFDGALNQEIFKNIHHLADFVFDQRDEAYKRLGEQMPDQKITWQYKTGKFVRLNWSDQDAASLEIEVRYGNYEISDLFFSFTGQVPGIEKLFQEWNNLN